MKVLQINGYFLLPDDFEGGYNEALEEYLKYRKEKKLSTFPLAENSIENKYSDLTKEEIWEHFLETVKEGRKFFGEIFYGELIDGEWHRFGSDE